MKLNEVRWFSDELSILEKEKRIARYHGLTKQDSEKLARLIHSGRIEKLTDIKSVYESVIEKNGNQKEIVYNVDAFKLGDVLNSCKLQCSSGTLMFSLFAMAHSLTKNAVVIFEYGHVLPGYVEKKKSADGNTSELHLVGFETTVAGQGIKNYGELRKVASNPNSGVRVITMDDYLNIEALKGGLTADQVPLIHHAAQARMEAKYALSETHWVSSTTESSPSCTQLNWSPMAFGQADVPPGDIQRAVRDVVSVGMLTAEVYAYPFDLKTEKLDSTMYEIDAMISQIGVFDKIDNDKKNYYQKEVEGIAALIHSVSKMPAGGRIGVVTFSGLAFVVFVEDPATKSITSYWSNQMVRPGAPEFNQQGNFKNLQDFRFNFMNSLPKYLRYLPEQTSISEPLTDDQLQDFEVNFYNTLKTNFQNM